MKNSICPKCDGREIYSNVGVRTINKNYLNLDAMTNPVPLAVYMCMNCGFLEYYVADTEGTQKVARKWPRVN